ncbi:MAG: iron chelate uptake ABC transporter family permease subunit [Ruminiclostridium sp.]
MHKKTAVRTSALFIIGAVAVVAIWLLNIALGSVEISISEIFASIVSPESVEKAKVSIVMNIRMPRAIAALCGGAALAVSGVLLQIFFSNPIVEPYILGISSGSNLFIAIVILGGYTFGMTSINSMGMFLGSFAGAMLVMIIVVLVSRKVRSVTTLLIIGLMLGYVCSAATSVLTMLSSAEKLAKYTARTMGSFSGFTWEQAGVLLAVSLPFLFAAFLMSKPLNAMLLGEKYASSMGVSVKGFRVAIVIVSSVLTAVVTAFSGAVSFVGLAVPHIVRILFRTGDNRIVIPACCLYGAVMTGLCDLAARLLLSPAELPLGAVTAVIGAPIAVYLLTSKKGGSL